MAAWFQKHVVIARHTNTPDGTTSFWFALALVLLILVRTEATLGSYMSMGKT